MNFEVGDVFIDENQKAYILKTIAYNGVLKYGVWLLSWRNPSSSVLKPSLDGEIYLSYEEIFKYFIFMERNNHRLYRQEANRARREFFIERERFNLANTLN